MSVPGYTKGEFGEQLNRVLSAAHPIRSIEKLRGRESEMEIIERALFADGRHIFIYGDRGVGKSSVAAAAAHQYQSSDASPIFVPAGPDDTFKSVVANIANKAIGRSRVESTKQTRSAGFEWRGLKWSAGTEVNPVEITSRLQSAGDAAELLFEASSRHSEKPIVVIDEFDTITDAPERNKFAHLLKLLGDQGTNLKLIFTGVGNSLDELLGAHPSAYRQLEQLELPRLAWEARREIVVSAAAEFALNVSDDVNWRIAIVSDGFPYYTHLITEHMLWDAFGEEREVMELGWSHYEAGLRAATLSINAQLKLPYEKAVSNRAESYEDVVWSTADGEDLHYSVSQMFDAYRWLAARRARSEVLTRLKYGEQVRRLKTASYGRILIGMSGRSGWYTYAERMLRGYVRMQAEVNGFPLTGGRMSPRQRMHTPGNVRTGAHGPSVPRGVDIDAPIRGQKG